MGAPQQGFRGETPERIVRSGAGDLLVDVLCPFLAEPVAAVDIDGVPGIAQVLAAECGIGIAQPGQEFVGIAAPVVIRQRGVEREGGVVQAGDLVVRIPVFDDLVQPGLELGHRFPQPFADPAPVQIADSELLVLEHEPCEFGRGVRRLAPGGVEHYVQASCTFYQRDVLAFELPLDFIEAPAVSCIVYQQALHYLAERVGHRFGKGDRQTVH